MRLGLDSYSLRWQGWDAFQLLQYAADLGLGNVHFSERTNLVSLDDAYLESLKRRAGALSLSIELGMLSFDQYSSFFRPEYGAGEQQLADMLRAARKIGSPIVRTVLGGQAERLGAMHIQQHVEEVLRVLRLVDPLAHELGINVAIENHGALDLLAHELEALVQQAGPEWVGVCLDTGNPAYAAEDPVVAAEVLAPYILSTQVRDTRIWSVADGALAQWVPMGQGNVDMVRILKILDEHAPEAPLNLEIITGYEPRLIPYADPDSEFWKMYPGMLARDFIRFTRLAETGSPGSLQQLTLLHGMHTPPPNAFGDRLIRQQRQHFEDSVRYCRDLLGTGSAVRSQAES